MFESNKGRALYVVAALFFCWAILEVSLRLGSPGTIIDTIEQTVRDQKIEARYAAAGERENHFRDDCFKLGGMVVGQDPDRACVMRSCLLPRYLGQHLPTPEP
jgi:hypothetical protein